MKNVNDLRKGDTILIDGELFSVLEAQHHKPGKGQAVMRTKVRNVRKGSIIDKTFTGGDKVEEATVTFRHMQYLYEDDGYVFMDLETYDQITVNEDVLGDDKYFLLENTEVDVQFYEDEVLSVNLPLHVVLEVTYTEPGFKGDTQSGGTKPAEVETGIKVNVPLFIEIGEKIKIDTRDKSYVERYKE